MEFKPCPFCGNTNIRIVSVYLNRTIGTAVDLCAWAECSRCGARSAERAIDTYDLEKGYLKLSEEERKNPKIVYDLWNRRVKE